MSKIEEQLINKMRSRAAAGKAKYGTTMQRTEKPLELISVFVEQFTEEGELVVDPFFGSGTVPLACKNLKRNFQGSDTSDEAHKHTQQRLGVLSLF
jgi:DNA modification methylase